MNVSETMPITLGVTEDGQTKVFDMARVPHLLICGAQEQISMTIAAINHSLRASMPPSKYEIITLSVSSGMEDAGRILTSLNRELEVRYEKLASARCRNIQGYLKRGKEMQYKVVVIEEYSQYTSDIISVLLLLAAKGRAVGILFMVATRHPDAVTGSFKLNFPARLLFRTESAGDSITVIDIPGAENLQGGGDALFEDQYDVTRIQVADIPMEQYHIDSDITTRT